MKEKITLNIELIPKTCWWSSVRTTVTKKDWDKIRFIAYEKANNKCEICGDTGKNQGYNHNVECHEIWDYNLNTKTQTLIGLIALCPICHQVKHIGRAIAIGKQNNAINQLIKVNDWSQEQVDEHIKESFKLYAERSKIQWKLDISLLTNEPYNLKLKPIKTRIFENHPFKKKKKTKKKKAKIKPRPKKK